ncbi:hypothetical protein H1C71_036202 [Ictidomys tridecemlineatus]|nr:hypothetical protein H1C71_036202 [Ictidomys tridecemlineatus]KAG3293686.1 hypothetical protein H1C71_036202 [Ictidomys tridecemlineatus]KAG3293687.1 hypothetical protein H1C71_036202 [Ictidomys tridecemlineatus]KAG3293688.1 hypothetical protein H1C71_036202 [Ictidomys tridecemlineatus]
MIQQSHFGVLKEGSRRAACTPRLTAVLERYTAGYGSNTSPVGGVHYEQNVCAHHGILFSLKKQCKAHDTTWMDLGDVLSEMSQSWGTRKSLPVRCLELRPRWSGHQGWRQGKGGVRVHQDSLHTS